MKHEIDLKKYQIRTDLAVDSITTDVSGLINKTKKIGDIKVTNTYLNKEYAKVIDKKEGNYTTLEFNDVTDYDNRINLTNVFTLELQDMMRKNKIKDDDSCLIIGLGNIESTPDSLGPLTIDNVLVTNHLFIYSDVEKGFRRTYSYTPSVMAKTGIETSDLIKSIVNTIKPDFVIVIDALASGSISRVNKTIQITDTGVHPGSGIGNNRKEISYEVLGIPVITVGVPTVVDAVTIVSDTINYMYKHYAYNKKNINKPKSKLILASNTNYLKDDIELDNDDKKKLLGLIGTFNDNEIRRLIYEVLTPIGYNLMVTPKEMDFVIKKLSDVLSTGINKALHKNKFN